MPRMLRPKAIVLPDTALLNGQHVAPRTKRFTHQVVEAQPFLGIGAAPDAAPQGHYVAGTKVRLLERGTGPLCMVQDGQGVRAMTAFAGLRALR